MSEICGRVTVTYRLYQDVSHFLLLVPVLHAVGDLLQEFLVMFQQFWDLVEDFIHQRRVTEDGVFWLLQWLHVALEREGMEHLEREAPHIKRDYLKQEAQCSKWWTPLYRTPSSDDIPLLLQYLCAAANYGHVVEWGKIRDK